MAQITLVGRLRRWLARMALSFGHIWLPVILVFPFLLFVYLRATNGQYRRRALPDGSVLPDAAWAGTPFDYVSWIWFAMFSSVLFFGALGSTVSFFSRRNPRAKEVDEPRSLIGAQIFGAVFATILMLTFLGGLVQGSLFPSIGFNSWISFDLRLNDWTKLLVWSFIAGFSERFVPDLLNNLVRRSSAADENREA